MGAYLPNITKILVGIDGQASPGADLDFLYEESSSKLYELGKRVCLSNGAVFHYALAGEAITINKLCEAPAAAADHDADLAGQATFAVGVKTVIVVNGASTTITENMFQGGQLYVNDVNGEGQNLFIKSHGSAAVNSNCTIELLMPVHVEITTSSQCGLAANPYYKVLIANTTQLSHPLGMSNKAITNAYYFWLQTWGPTTAISDAGVPVKGGSIGMSTTTTGCISDIATSAAGFPIGFAGQLAGVDGETLPIWLTLGP